MQNAIGRTLPEHVEGYGRLLPFQGAFSRNAEGRRHAPPVKALRPGERKTVEGMEALFDRIPIRSGMTLSFHHHFRNGDKVLNMVLAEAARRGLKGLKLAPSALFPVHAPLIDHVRTGVVADIDTNYVAGPVARAASAGLFPRPVVLRTHGGRARAIECGDLKIDVAFVAAPAADDYGNLNGVLGPAACGSLGYAFPDAEYADSVVAVTDHLADYPLAPISIPQTRVDWVVRVESVGDPAGIVSGITRITEDEAQLAMARKAAEVIEAAGLIREGFSFQTGAGAASLATAHFLAGLMEQRGICGSFGLGGVTGQMVAMLERGLIRRILDVQGFDLEAVRSLGANPNHVEIGSSFYANPFNCGCAVNRLECAILGAAEIDTDFNVNVVTGSDGVILGGSGGHSDVAAGAGLTVIVASLVRGRLPIVRESVLCATTPGETVDVLVTDHGIAVNPRRPDLAARLADAGLPVTDIQSLKVLAERLGAKAPPLDQREKIVAVVEYRDGTVIDVLRQAGS